MLANSHAQSEGLYIKEKEEGGFILVANRDFKAGDFIASEIPIWMVEEKQTGAEHLQQLEMM